MLDERGCFDFAEEILDLVGRFWHCYEESEGCPASRKERLLALAYVVAVLRQDISQVWAQLLDEPELQGIDVGRLLEEELGSIDSDRIEALRAAMCRRDWLAGGQAGGDPRG